MSLDDVFKEFEQLASGEEPEEKKEEKKTVNKPEPKPIKEAIESIVKEVGVGKGVTKPVPELSLNVEFDLSEDEEIPKYVFLIYGEKGSGKTMTALSFIKATGGHGLVLSFDKRTNPIRFAYYRDISKNIHVFDALKYLDTSMPKRAVETAELTYRYILYILEQFPNKYGEPDWVVFDYSSVLTEICEWAARYRHGINTPIGGADWNVWRHRNLLILDIHNKALQVAKHGIIYTCYHKVEPQIILNGQVVHQVKVPKWIDDLFARVDFVLETSKDITGKKFIVKVISSKIDDLLQTGAVYDVTGRYFWDVVFEQNPKARNLLARRFE